MQKKTPVIELSDITFRWSKQQNSILSIPKMIVYQGEHLFIKGSSGSGKTTLLNIISGINSVNSGKVQVLGHNFNDLTMIQRDQFRVDHLGVIFQQFNLLTYLSLVDNVQLPCWFSKHRRARAGDVKGASLRLLEELKIPNSLLDKPVSSLSVGQQQRVAVARALIGKPEIIIADEPTSALDTDNRKNFLDLLFREADQQGSTLIFVSHDPHIANNFSRIIEMSDINHISQNQQEFVR